MINNKTIEAKFDLLIFASAPSFQTVASIIKENFRKIGVDAEVYKTAPRADAESLFRPYTAEEKAELKRKVQQFYGLFLHRVAEGRGMSKQEVDAVARGRVWTGRQAWERKLVDELGGLMEAVQRSRESARIPEHAKVRVVHYYRHRKLWEQLMPGMRPPLLALDLIERMERLATQGILLEMPFSIRIR